MELYEKLVMWYLTKDKYVFISPQYSIRGDTGKEWSCPDFVALNFKQKEVSIVEVSTAFYPDSLARKVKDRNLQWIEKLKAQLTDYGIIDDNWKSPKVQVFIRRDAVDKFKNAIGNTPDVGVGILEDLGPPWQWSRTL
jgi:hypothetical protein